MIIHDDIEQGSGDWFKLRSGLPTASVASKLVSSTGKESTQYKELALTLSADLYAGEPVDAWDGNAATMRGTELEPEARSAYEFMKDVEVKKLGFVTDDDALFGCSPDGLVNDDGLLEIKCQQAKGHVKTLDYFAKNGKAPPDYIPQCQMQMYVTERSYTDLFHYHPMLPSIVIRIKADDKFHQVLKQQLKVVIAERDRLMTMLRSC